MIKNPLLDIAYTCAKALRRRKTLYATGPVLCGRNSSRAGNQDTTKTWSMIYVTMDGIQYKVTVEEVKPSLPI